MVTDTLQAAKRLKKKKIESKIMEVLGFSLAVGDAAQLTIADLDCDCI